MSLSAAPRHRVERAFPEKAGCRPRSLRGYLRMGAINSSTVRDETQYAICALRGFHQCTLDRQCRELARLCYAERSVGLRDGKQHYIVCRLGNDSQLAAQAIMQRAQIPIIIKDIKGGFKAWREGGWILLGRITR